MIERLEFSDTWIRKLKPSAERREYFDTYTRGLGVRISTRGDKTFFLMTRFPGGKHPTRRTLFEYSSVNADFGLSAARSLAVSWREGARRGLDVRERERSENAAANASDAAAAESKREAELAEKNVYEFVVERYFTLGTRRLRAGSLSRVRATIERRCLKRWRGKNINKISRSDVIEILEGLRLRGKTAQAFNSFAHMRAFLTGLSLPKMRTLIF